MIDESPDDGEMLTEGRRICAAIATRRQSSCSVNVARALAPAGSPMNMTIVLVASGAAIPSARGARDGRTALTCPGWPACGVGGTGAGQLTLDVANVSSHEPCEALDHVAVKQGPVWHHEWPSLSAG